MIPDPETIKRIEAEAASYGDGKMTSIELAYSAINALPGKIRGVIARAIEHAYLAGADAGYTAAKAEERKP